ncbi:MAG: hypothetical protein ABFD10_03975, partial [Prolixibacteraceae bacterium]
KPVQKAINKWSDLKNFRNEIIAHNFRNSKGEFKLFSIGDYNCPQTHEELSYLVAFLNRMVRVLSSNFPMETQNIINSVGANLKRKANQSGTGDSKFEELKRTLQNIDEYISEEIFSIVRYDIISANTKTIQENAK